MRTRCVRADEVSATVRCHYLTDGTVNFAFTVRRAEYFVPAGVLLKCFLDVSDRELFAQLLALAPDVRPAFCINRAKGPCTLAVPWLYISSCCHCDACGIACVTSEKSPLQQTGCTRSCKRIRRSGRNI